MNKKTAQLAQLAAISAVGALILEAIPESGAPNGHFYAALMGKLNLSQYQQIIAGLKKSKAITESGHYFERGPEYKTTLDKLNKVAKTFKGLSDEISENP